MNESTPLGPFILSGVTALGSLAALWGVYLSQRRQPYEHRLITTQADEHEAAAESKAVEASHKAVDSLSRALDRAEGLVERLVQERVEWEARERILETQLEESHTQKRCAEALAGELAEEVKRLRAPPARGDNG